MTKRAILICGLACWCASFAPLRALRADHTTYHLHHDYQVGTGLNAIRTLASYGPDVASVGIASDNIKNLPVFSREALIGHFGTPVGVPGTSAVIPAGASTNLSLWMRKTARWGTFQARAQVDLFQFVDGRYTLVDRLASCDGPEIPATLTKLIFSCVSANSVTVSPADRIIVTVLARIVQHPGSHSVRAELWVEGVLDAAHDSTVQIPNGEAP